MTRLLNHHFRRQIFVQVACDLLATTLVFMVAYWFLVREGNPYVVPTTDGLSVLAGLLFINTASGLYSPAPGRSLNQARAAEQL